MVVYAEMQSGRDHNRVGQRTKDRESGERKERPRSLHCCIFEEEVTQRETQHIQLQCATKEAQVIPML